MVAVVAAALLVMSRSTAAMASLAATLASTSATVDSPIPAAATWRMRTCAPPPVHRRRRRCGTARVRWVA